MHEEMSQQLAELSDTYRELFRKQFAGLAPGVVNLRGDEAFVKWFLMNAQADPNWVPHLEYVDGGKDVLRRFNRVVMGALGGGVQREGEY